MLKQFARQVTDAQEQNLGRFLAPGDLAAPEAAKSAVDLALINHYHNCRLWKEEDLARRTAVAASEIVANKRAIDRFNQARNDAVERLDEYLITQFDFSGSASVQHSETPGAIVDRLSILSLKKYHMYQQTQRQDIGDDKRGEMNTRLELLRQQHRDLSECLQYLLDNCAVGSSSFRLYRQLKMYNDPQYKMRCAPETT